MKTFFGICVAMGILKLPEIHLYWQRKCSLFQIADWNQHMNRDSFIAILRYLKFCDEEVESQPQQVAPDQPPAHPDKLYKGRHFLDQLLPRQFVANKPKRFGIKQQIYTGKDVEQRTPEVGLGTRVVLDLTQGYENQGYIVVTDNFYTSPTLAQKLLQKGINSLGTVKGNTR
ncbi:PiggyBac transposable element-derived protein 4, partial [Acropora cervicornis]